MADRNDADSLRDALYSRRFEVVFDNVYDWERGTTADQVEATVRAVGDRLSRYIFLSSVAAYGDGLNHKESDPLAPDYHSDPYVRHKATTERLLFRMHVAERLAGGDVPPAVRVRTRQPFLPGAVLLGSPARRTADHHSRRWPPADAVRISNDLVQSMVRAMTSHAPMGEAFNIGDPKPLTQAELVERLAKVANSEGNAGAGAARHHLPGRGQRRGGALLFRRILRPAAHHRKHRQSDPGPEDEAHAVRCGPEGNLPLVPRNHKSRTAGFEFDDVCWRWPGRAQPPTYKAGQASSASSRFLAAALRRNQPVCRWNQ